MSTRQSGIWPIFCQFMAILGKLVDMYLKFILPSSYINFDMQTNFEVNQTQIGHSVLCSLKILQKSLNGHAYLKTRFCPSVIHQKAYSSYIFQWICLKSILGSNFFKCIQ